MSIRSRHNQARNNRYCIIGAGYYGLALAKTFNDFNIPYDHFEKNEDIGGNWLNGTYDSVRTITSRRSMDFCGYRMPRSYGTFPSQKQVWGYLDSYSTTFNLRKRIEFNCEVKRLDPVGKNGEGGWNITLADGRSMHYAGVVIASGYNSRKRIPDNASEFSGEQLHSIDYKNVGNITGPKVLIVGARPSGCDISVEVAEHFGHASICMRSVNYYLPKKLFGVALFDLDRLWLPLALRRGIVRLAAVALKSTNRHLGLPQPAHRLMDHPPVVNSKFLKLLRKGQITVKPAIKEIHGDVVTFDDESELRFDTVVWATGFQIDLPEIPVPIETNERGLPLLVNQLMVDNVSNLYFFGFVRPRCGTGRVASKIARTLAKLITAQEATPEPIVNHFSKFNKPSGPLSYGGGKILRQLVFTEFMLKVILFYSKERAGRKRI